MRELPSTITSKGQVTIPAEVRKHLGLKQGDKISFVIEDEGRVELKVPSYPTIASLVGAAGTLKQPLSMEQMLEIAREDELEDDYRQTT
jgi:antitoxin PrlF